MKCLKCSVISTLSYLSLLKQHLLIVLICVFNQLLDVNLLSLCLMYIKIYNQHCHNLLVFFSLPCSVVKFDYNWFCGLGVVI